MPHMVAAVQAGERGAALCEPLAVGETGLIEASRAESDRLDPYPPGAPWVLT